MENRLSFNDVLEKTSKEHKIYVDELGGFIPYGDLTLEDFIEITKSKPDSDVEWNRRILYAAWRHADPTVTLDGISKKIPVKLILKIVKEIVPVVFPTVPLGNSPEAKADKQSTSSKSSVSLSTKSAK